MKICAKSVYGIKYVADRADQYIRRCTGRCYRITAIALPSCNFASTNNQSTREKRLRCNIQCIYVSVDVYKNMYYIACSRIWNDVMRYITRELVNAAGLAATTI